MHEIRSPMIRPAATLFRVALTVFVITIVIGILNGLDVWDPGRDTLLTHVHAGTLGWITLAVIGASLLLFTDGQDPTPAERRGAQRLSILASVAIGLYVLAFWSGSGIQRPIAGTLVFVAVLWLYAWVLGRIRRGGLTIPRFAMAAALTSLVIGAVFGILLGLFLARGNVPGLADRIAGRLSDAHPGTMVIGYLLLAGTAIAEWLLRREHRPLSASRWGVVQVLAIFLAGAILIVGFLSENEDLAAVNLPLELLGVGIFLVRMWPDVRPRTWAAADAAGRFARWGVAWLIVNLGLLAYVVQLFLNDPNAFDDPDNLGVALAFDHTMFVGVITNLMFAAMVAVAALRSGTIRLTVWGIQIGLAGFAVGLITESPVLKRISTPIMGLALLLGIVLLLGALRSDRASRPALETA